MKHTQDILDQAQGTTLLSFDIFDTVLLRPPVSEFYHFWRISRRFYAYLKTQECSPKLSLKDVFQARLLSWRTAYKEAPIAQGCREARLCEILNLMCVYLGCNLSHVQKLHQIELQVEGETLRLNKDLFKIIALTKAQGKKIVFTSDMYLSEEDIRKICHAFMPHFEWDAGYVSSDVRLSKRHDGHLFSYLIEKEGVSSERILHIGDSFQGDFCHPRQKGCKALYWPRSFFWRSTKKIQERLFLVILRLYGIEGAL